MPHAPDTRTADPASSTLLALAGSLAPARWREALGLRGEASLRMGAGLTGIAQILLGGLAWIHFTFAAYLEATSAGGPGLDAPGLQPAKVVGFLAAMLSPMSLLSLGFAVEGAFRLVAAVAGSVVGTLPLWLLAEGATLAGLGLTRARSRPPLPDRATREGDDWVVECSARKAWGETLTLEVEGALYRVAEESERAEGELRWRYRLVPIDSAWLVRRVEVYPRLEPAGASDG